MFGQDKRFDGYVPSLPTEEVIEILELKIENKYSKQSNGGYIIKFLNKFLGKNPKNLSNNKEKPTLQDYETHRKIIEKLSKKYVEEHAKYINEIFKQNYRKTIINEEKKNIIIYAKIPLSKVQVYSIAQVYKNAAFYKTQENFEEYLEWCYYKFDDIRELKNRMNLYEYVEDYLLIILDASPEELGFDSTVMKMTKFFNVKKDNGQYQTAIKAYIDFDIIVNSNEIISIEEVISIMNAHRKVKSYVWEYENGPSRTELINELKDKNFSRNIKSYKYHNGFLEIEVE